MGEKVRAAPKRNLGKEEGKEKSLRKVGIAD